MINRAKGTWTQKDRDVQVVKIGDENDHDNVSISAC